MPSDEKARDVGSELSAEGVSLGKLLKSVYFDELGKGEVLKEEEEPLFAIWVWDRNIDTIQFKVTALLNRHICDDR
ncbi:unnamed protein product [Leptosia nina]|uniref:Uncharacterized protein n=1 Tax=Leptosia nina TaxID=320188 RepID=A0AAV1IXG8_9NEOP